MSKNSKSLESIKPEALNALVRLGQRMRANRLQQGWTIEEMAARLFCSHVTYASIEAGKPGASVGLIVNALWLLGILDSLDQVAPMPIGLAIGRRARRKSNNPPGSISEAERDF